MSKELEDRISDWVDGEVAGVDPVTVDEAIARCTEPTVAPMAGVSARRRWLVPAVAAVVVVLAGAVGVMTLRDSEPADRVISAGEERLGEEVDSIGGAGEPAPEGSAAACTITAESTAPVDLDIENFGDPIAQIKIPKIGVDHSVVEGESAENLKRGPGHYSGTPLPGQAGNSAIAGHRSTYGAPFRDIDKLATGDQIIVQTMQGMFVYEVDRTGVLEPTRVDVLDNKGDNRITLTSCHPKYSMQERIIVSGVLIGEPAGPVNQPAHPIGFAWLPEEAEVLHGYYSSDSTSQSAHVHFPDETGSSTPSEDITVRLNTLNTTLQLTRMEMDAEHSDSVAKFIEMVEAMQAELGTDRALEAAPPPVRERIEVRGVPAVLDRWWHGTQETTRVTFFEYDNLAVEVTSHGITDEDLYRIIESLQLAAVGVPAG